MKFGPTRGNILLIFEHFLRDFGLLIIFVLVGLWKGTDVILDNIQFLIIVLINPISVFFRYFFTKYSIDDEKMIVNSGVFVRKTMDIPLKAITTVDLSQNILFQLFDVYKIKADNASQTNDRAKQAEVLLALKKDEAIFVKSLLESKGNHHEELHEELSKEFQSDKVAHNNIVQDLEPSISCTTTDFILLGLLQSKLVYIITTFSALIGGFFYVYSILFEGSDPIKLIEKLFYILTPTIAILVLIIVTYVTGLVASSISAALRYFNYTVKNSEDDLFVEFGLFTKKSYTLKKEKISGINIKQSILMRLFGYCTVEVFIIGYGDRSEGNDKELSMLYPIAKLSQVNIKLNEILPEMSFDRNYIKAEKGALRYFFYCARMVFAIGVLIGIVIAIVLYYTNKTLLLGIIVSLGYLLLTIISIYLEYRMAGIYANDKVVSICHGIVSKQMIFIKTEKIESISDQTTIWKRKKGFTNIKFGFLAPLRVANIKAFNVTYEQYENVHKVLIL